MENLVDSDHSEQLVTFPDDDSTPTEERDIGDLSVAAVLASSGSAINGDQLVIHGSGGPMCMAGSADIVKFEEKHTSSTSKRKIVTDGFSTEQVH